MVTQLQPDVRAYLHGAEVIKRYIRVEEVAREYGLSVEETEYIAKAAGSLYKLLPLNRGKDEASGRATKMKRWQSTDMSPKEPLMHTTGHLSRISSVLSVRL